MVLEEALDLSFDRLLMMMMIVLAREGAEVHLHAAQTKTEHFWLCVWANCHLEKLHHC